MSNILFTLLHLAAPVIFLGGTVWIYIKQYRWQLRMREKFPTLYKESSPPPKWWNVRRIWDWDDGLDDKFPPSR